MTSRTTAFSAFVGALAACGARTMNLGSNDGGETTAAPVSASSPDASYGGFAGAAPCTVPPVLDTDGGDRGDAGASLAPLVGTWTGYIETLPASSGNLTLVFTAQADGSVTGSLTFGTASAPPPPVSATVLYPPGFSGDPNSEPFPFPGFPYTAINLSFDGSRLQFGIVKYELWMAWCGLQTSYAWSFAGQCGCLPNWNYTILTTDDAGISEIALTGTGETEVVSYGLLATCAGPYSPCYCTAAGCSTDMETADSTLDVQLEANELDGQITGGLNVLLSRSP